MMFVDLVMSLNSPRLVKDFLSVMLRLIMSSES